MTGGAAERKAQLRAELRGARGRTRGDAAIAAADRLMALPELGEARVIALYSAIGDEVPVDAVAESCRARGALVVYPIVVGPELELAPDVRAERVPASQVDLFIVPGQGFDRQGRRLGRGGGHYDRLLARRRAGATIVGVCYTDRLVPDLPADPWDVAIHVLVTDQSVLRFAAT